jgi:hypothetical protein
MATHRVLRSRWGKWASGLLLIAAGCAEPQAQTPAMVLPIAPGQARIWFYRPYEPYESLNLADIDVNGSYFGSVAIGTALYRDVSPGCYHIAPVTYGRDVNQDLNVVLAPGQQLYIKIVSLRSWAQGLGKNFERDTFYAWRIAPQVAQVEIARDRSGI